jgi:anti-anti-sigma regulatory factor
MLRITVSGQDSSCRIIKLEGKLLHDWINEVRRLFLDVDGGPIPTLDLSGLSFVDREGAELLLQLLRNGVRIESCSPFVAELLGLDRDTNAYAQ